MFSISWHMFKNPRRILIIDTDAERCTLLVDYLRLEGFHALPAHAVEAGLDAVEHEALDLIICDEVMPGMTGKAMLAALRTRSDTPVLMLADTEEDAEAIKKAGADDAVVKPCPPRELYAHIGGILRRSSSSRATATPIVVGPLVVNPTERVAKAGNRPVELTTIEFSLFELLARNAGGPVSKEEIYPKVLGRPMGPYDRAIDVHVSSIRHKLSAVVGKALAIESVRGVGYQLIVRPPEELQSL